MKPIEERKEAFRKRLADYCEEHDPKCIKYPKWLRKEFWNHYTAVLEGGTKVKKKDIGKMLFEIQETWSTGGRLATFINNSKQWHPEKWNKQPKPVHKIRTSNSDYQPKIDYEKHKKNLERTNEPTRIDKIRQKFGR